MSPRRNRVKRVCGNCGKEFELPRSLAERQGKFCSMECWQRSLDAWENLTCECCGKQFVGYKSRERRFCSRSCADKGRHDPVTRTCVSCGKEYEINRYRAEHLSSHYCSRECQGRGTSQQVERICVVCQQKFSVSLYVAKRGGGVYCSEACQARGQRKRVKCTCEYCGKTFERTPFAIDKGEGRFCSYDCSNKGRQRRVACICIVCGKEFELAKSYIDDGRGRFCSQACFLRYSGETSIEQMIRKELERRGEPFEQQVKFKRYHVDFVLLNRNVVIECDGSYWHRLFKVVVRDRRKDDYLASLGYQVFRFTEREIRKSPSDCVDRVLIKA